MSSKAATGVKVREQQPGWVAVAGIVLLYLTLYALNFWLPRSQVNYTSRIWDWSQLALTLAAGLTLLIRRQLPTVRVAGLGLALAVVSALSHWLHNPDPATAWQEGLGVWLCFWAAALLFQDMDGRAVPAFQTPVAKIGRSVLTGVILAVPLAILNNIYFYLNVGPVEWQSAWASALAALSPAIHEEVMYRFFVFAFVLKLLGPGTAPRWASLIAVSLAVIPHSLNHLPDLFRENLAAGLFMLVATSLLFGLPMAMLQVRKNLETAIAFHWFIDFARFVFGY